MADDKDERAEAVNDWPDLIADITKAVRKTRHGRLKTEILDLDASLRALHWKACNVPPQMATIDPDDARLCAVMTWPALVSDITKVVARTGSTLHATDILAPDDVFLKLHGRVEKIPADGIAIHHATAPKPPQQVYSKDTDSSDLSVSPSIRHLIPHETSDSRTAGTNAEPDLAPSGKLANRPKVPGIVQSIRRPHRDHEFQHQDTNTVYQGRLFDNVNVDFEKSEKKPRIISAPEGSTGLMNEFSLPLEQRPPGRSLEDALQVDMRSRFGIQHAWKPSVYNHGSRILILWGQEDPQQGLTAPD
ncbi:hypothetical protein DL98DRAFT_613095 [Cadophora sp. DSE1049]|nr:hypothetical protein DL98DRAFT_613095 [Cadophora sp. DSE1049]